MKELKNLSMEEQCMINGGFWVGPPPKWAIDVGIAIGQSAKLFIEGFKEGSREI
ncbi:hypothetical protein PP178_08420 [Zeaxanthinibacter sp. PT1]|uniref:hypothetical protein n=1 Tax=Zeaxanthinibacter TaxID=561554 RepID=UPI00234A8D78|nr:hypothetical protein [Zeaxanthinibacter sp. PT1]MDC6351578.1 hypothetical protein [Zeaxanthinibacter sp. PT1]